ncbi:GspE/PulE family protein [Desulfotalea psychrophila]|uniref:Probable general secretion pathway protein E n=1 Tax=Desulfotalea psychrophila (strain LSv54 / DSM 12343) TaxID=177439 RepID=Q6AQX2_DESPS|nr:GspE/PulE family protein [Desulfotalea psychrophila]CAG35252.1 probable general secretion pathway protein E [Desulfotalea psychrophila LSv54]
MNIVTKTIPYSFASRHLIVPIEQKGTHLKVAVYHPDSKDVLHDIEQANQLQVSACLATKADIRKILSEFFGFQRSISAAESQCGSFRDDMSVDIGNLERYVKISSTKELTSSDQHIKSALNHIFQYALDQRASDIHVEPKRETTMVRFRIDGALHIIYTLPKAVHSALISRIKFLARLDIAEKRRPQDGRIKLGAKNNLEVEVRVSTVPVSFGEKVVMRILDPSVIFQDISGLGLSPRDLHVYNSCIAAPHGIFLVTGPTGSGKSTTLYSTLKAISSSEKNIVTVEDPVEMVYEEFNQIAVQPLIDVTFSTILRNILRQDPDIIMIGEIRDHETAAHAVQAAMTGHLVFSTLHTNDAASAVARLEDLGLQPFMIASTLLGCMAQRLVKTICTSCAEEYSVSCQELRRMGFPVEGDGEMRLKRGKGCRECRGTGYRGRCGIFEIFPVSPPLKRLIGTGELGGDVEQLAIREGMTTLREDAWQKVQAGITTCEEVLRVTSDDNFKPFSA